MYYSQHTSTTADMLAARTRLYATRTRLFHSCAQLWRQSVVSYDEIKSASSSPSRQKRIIDVREPDEFSAGNIPSSFNVPLSSFEQSLSLSADEFKRRFSFDKPGKEDEVVFYCRAGVRSTNASNIAEKLGYSKIGNYKGSWNEWSSRSSSSDSGSSSGGGDKSGETVNLKELNEKEQARADKQQPEGNKTGDKPLAQTKKGEESESVHNGAELAGEGDQKKFS